MINTDTVWMPKRHANYDALASYRRDVNDTSVQLPVVNNILSSDRGSNAADMQSGDY